MLVDSHCHLNEITNIDEIIKEALINNVKIMLSNSIDLNSMKQNLELSKKFESIKPCFGIHPAEVLKENISESLNFIEKNISKCYGIGETGLDFVDTSENLIEKQYFVFEKLIELSKKHNKAIICHSRRSRKEVLDRLEENNCEKVLLHWFNAGKGLMKRAFSLNYYVSVGPLVLFDSWMEGKVKLIPIDKLLLETDSPVPFNGESSNPGWIKKISEKVSSIYEISNEELENQLYENAKNLFGV